MHEMGGRAKAMVVTGSRLAAVKYKLAFDRYIKDHGYTGIRSLVAFSGTVEDPDDPGSSYTEVSMNGGIAESELPETFERDDYRVLIVAEKYQTGFDQPLLQTMYVVKRLAGVQAVQTLVASQPYRSRQGANLRSRFRERGGRHLPGVQALLRGHARSARTPIRIASRNCSTSCLTGRSSHLTTSMPSPRSGTTRSAIIRRPITG